MALHGMAWHGMAGTSHPPLLQQPAMPVCTRSSGNAAASSLTWASIKSHGRPPAQHA
ncbi:hypothetical protein M441DRAFT_68967 [Trichoderma asperellum CBS 433.97]|uniref:Uncharacterized protein n=1 Tax=Trichoderma asperellum (strain ATCC 204424 / CBS 433.97 / NBRC 101777) TaxID=1042311 RepID=A0A2T3Z6R1_TRIA4|nr:hypothetical protein M441DRAFT_68967 [Trichoderma asperellum CBS 433.97]PTB40511.1 hypothetical protein M441DRAFT_68967 [Trichoderma asperellum CBS 433.97]